MFHSAIRHSLEPSDGQEAQVHHCRYLESRFPVSVDLMNLRRENQLTKIK
jgi:hypothetical protein